MVVCWNMEQKKKNKKKYYGAIIIAAIIIIGSVITVFLLNYYEKNGVVSSNYIEIAQDKDFKFKYNFPGDGSSINPYIIENYNLSRTDGITISISFTTKHFIIRNCTLSDSHSGVFLDNIAPDTATITNNTFINNLYGLRAYNCMSLNITQSIFQSNNIGVYLTGSNYASISEITCSNHTNAFWAEDSEYGHFFNNTFLDSEEEAGIVFSNHWTIENNIDVSMILLTGNQHLYYNNVFYNNGSVIANIDNFYMADNYFAGEFNFVTINELKHSFIVNNTFLNGGFDFGDFTSADNLPYLFEDNFVNNKPVLFLANQAEVLIDNSTFGQIFCFNCTNVNVSNGNFTNTISAINCYECENVTITNNTVTSIRVDEETSRGLFTFGCDETLVANNTITQCDFGLYIYFATNLTVQDNFFTQNNIGIKVEVFDKFIIQDNNCTYNNEGIHVEDMYFSGPNKVLNNNCSYNTNAGIRLFSVDDCEIKNNTLTNNQFGLYLNVDHGNISKNTILDNTLFGIYFYYSDICYVYENSVIGNELGIGLYRSYYIFIFHNNVTSSNTYGVHISATTYYSEVYLNNFINNSILYPSNSQAFDDGYDSIFYDSDNMLGNYWSDWLSGNYSIDGSAGTEDIFPQSSPIVF